MTQIHSIKDMLEFKKSGYDSSLSFTSSSIAKRSVSMKQDGEVFGQKKYVNPADSEEVYYEFMEPSSPDKNLLGRTPLPFYSAAWNRVMTRFATELPPEVLKKINDAYQQELDAINRGVDSERARLGGDYDSFDIMHENSMKDQALHHHADNIARAQEEHQKKTEEDAKKKAEKLYDKKAKKDKGDDVEDDVYDVEVKPYEPPKEEQFDDGSNPF